MRHCAPTLAGLKTANLFACPFSDGDALRRCLCCWNRRLTKKGLRILPLRFEGRRALIYVYRPARLACDLRQAAACRLLEERGYPVGGSSERCIIHIFDKYSKVCNSKKPFVFNDIRCFVLRTIR